MSYDNSAGHEAVVNLNEHIDLDNQEGVSWCTNVRGTALRLADLRWSRHCGGLAAEPKKAVVINVEYPKTITRMSR